MSLISDAIWAPAPSTARGQPTPLSADAKGERIAYASNKSIFLRSIDNPSLSTQYVSHTAQTTVARFSPSGFYVASGDVTGTVRVWDCAGDGATKGEYHIISGRINDIAWDGDSQRIIAVGDGRERFGHCITADSGNTVGEISGHTGQINCVSVRQQRPLRAATGSIDGNVVFLHGAPFKYNTTLSGQHSNFVYGLAFSPDGSTLVSVGADRKIWLYDGKTGEVRGQIGEAEQHKGSIFGVSWSSDSKKFATSSADQTVKLWDVEAGKSTQTWRLGEEGQISIPNHQVGVVWPSGRTDGLIVSLSLNGSLNYFNEGTPSPTRVVQGHQQNITSLAVTGYGKDATIWTGSSTGKVCSWDASTGSATHTDGEAHSTFVEAITAPADGKRIYSVGWDDTLRTIDASANTFLGSTTSLGAQPKGAATFEDKVLVIENSSIDVYSSSGNKVSSLTVAFNPTCISAGRNGVVAVGSDDHVVRLFTFKSNALVAAASEIKDSTSPVTTLGFSASGSLLAVGTSTGKIFTYKVSASGVPELVTNRWSAHNARVTSIVWNKAETHAVSGSLDTHVFVWSLARPGDRIKAANAHKEGVNAVGWIDDAKVVSAGRNASVRVWAVGL